MEHQTPQNQHQTANDNNTATQDHTNDDSKAANGNANNGGFLCRQSSSRWTPTTDQIRILKELYYTNGMRSPTAEQIQRISARLRQYGKIEGKNVFYWFQNHKARERQKKRFTSDHPLHNNNLNVAQRSGVVSTSVAATSSASAWKPHDYQAFHNCPVKYSNSSPVVCGNHSSASAVGVNGQIGNYPYEYGGVGNMEKAFREQCGSSGPHNLGWVGSADPCSPTYALFDRRSAIPLDDDDEEQASPEIETLPLFPMHGEDFNRRFSHVGGYYSGYEGGGVGHVSSRTSLELSLSFYGHMSPDSL